jgi:autotransporter strand-loop-strand O-heptosyltransferase
MASTMGAKHWNNPTGWQETVNYLKKLGYDVILLQTQPISYMGSPDIKGVIHPKTSIEEVLNYLLHAEFFIGLSSGISWLAWALDKKVVMISGFTKAINEFYTPWRIINKEVCNGCWNELNELNKGDWNWCPHHKNSSRHFECTKTITFERVKIAIENLIASKSQ